MKNLVATIYSNILQDTQELRIWFGLVWGLGDNAAYSIGKPSLQLQVLNWTSPYEIGLQKMQKQLPGFLMIKKHPLC